ncbi:hypothetical protein [Burkholderia stagnalis]|uniref:hypothetical protein n=1 Tax=Burkholderia stagnalis TaxID=1503054 RepID=UPI000758D1E7|nr:hypothetical protein [Burkholderia stagnalis]KWI31114.1 hypothetical protein WT71_11900 [Burkholderia stagnalis]KWI43371.1 hypothetical protein WM06_27175 [Burkholderia cepacia]KWI81919.1 hypothetical protein WT73_03545 [Burkholderia stagnalis]
MSDQISITIDNAGLNTIYSGGHYVTLVKDVVAQPPAQGNHADCMDCVPVARHGRDHTSHQRRLRQAQAAVYVQDLVALFLSSGQNGMVIPAVPADPLDVPLVPGDVNIVFDDATSRFVPV